MVQFWYICMCRQDNLISWLNMIDHWDHVACCNIENLAQSKNSVYQVPNRLVSLFSWFVVTTKLWMTFDIGHTWKLQKIPNVLNRAEGLWLMRVCDWLGEKGIVLGCYLCMEFLWTPFLSAIWALDDSRYGPPGVTQWMLT